MNSRITMGRCSFIFLQAGNTLGTTEETESLEVMFETQLEDAREGNFIVLKTSGWSIDDAKELSELLISVNPCIDNTKK